MQVARERVRSTAALEATIVGVIILTVVVAFLPTFRNGFVIWDDDLNFTNNTAYRGLGTTQISWMFTTLTGGHYQPLAWLTLGLDYSLWGMDARGYHATSLLLHVANAVCCYFLIRALLEAATPPTNGVRHRRRDRRPASWHDDPARVRIAAAFGALVFALHPLRVESVAWVSERRDVLSGLFLLLTVLAYLRAHAPAIPSRTRRRLILLSLACFVASLLSKAWGMTLPVVLLILDLYPLRRRARGEPLRAIVVEKLPYAVLAAAAAAMALGAQSLMPQMRTLAEHGIVARLAQAAYGLLFYPWTTLVPLRLSPAYLLEMPLDPTAPRYVVSAVIVAAIAAAAIVVGRRLPWALAALGCYVVTVSPVLGLAQTGPQLVADRYSYLATIPFAVLAAAAFAVTSVGRERAVGLVAALTLVVLATLTFQQTRIWHDSVTLWTHTLAIDPDNYIAWGNRGWARQLDGDLAGAIDDYNGAIAANPRYALAYYDRGSARDERGELDAALADYDRAIDLDPRDARALNNRGYVREREGDLAAAIGDYRRALEVAPPDFVHRRLVEGNLTRAGAALAASRLH